MNNPLVIEQIEKQEERILAILKTITHIQKLSTHKYFADMQRLWGNDVVFT